MKKSIKTRVIARTRKNPLSDVITTSTGHELQPAKWVFIVGCYNSGTTLLNELLSRHPQISGLDDEGVMLTSYLPKPEDFGWHRMWAKCYNKLTINGAGDHEALAGKIKRQWSHFYPASAEAVLLEKSIANTTRIPFLQKHFKPAYFIHIVRNGYAVAEGLRRKSNPMKFDRTEFEKGYPISLCAHQWRESIELVENQRDDITNLLEIKYEDFTTDTQQVLDRITSFLAIDNFQNSVAEKAFQIHEKKSTIKNMNPRSLKKLSEDDIQAIEDEAGDLLKKLNYTAYA